MFWFWIIFNYFKVSCSHNSILTCHIAGLIFLPQCSTVKYPPKKGEWRTLKYKSKPDLFITSGDVVFQFHFPDPHQWKSLSLKHWPASHLDWRWRCLLSLPSRAAAIAASKPRVPTVAIHYCIPLAWPQVLSHAAALSELWWGCCINVGAERVALLCSSKRDEQQCQFASLDVLPLEWEGILLLGVPEGNELQLWSFGLDKWFSHFTAISPIVIFIFCLGGLQLPYLFILLFAFRASLCLSPPLVCPPFFSPSDFICNLHFNLAR